MKAKGTEEVPLRYFVLMSDDYVKHARLRVCNVKKCAIIQIRKYLIRTIKSKAMQKSDTKLTDMGLSDARAWRTAQPCRNAVCPGQFKVMAKVLEKRSPCTEPNTLNLGFMWQSTWRVNRPRHRFLLPERMKRYRNT